MKIIRMEIEVNIPVDSQLTDAEIEAGRTEAERMAIERLWGLLYELRAGTSHSVRAIIAEFDDNLNHNWSVTNPTS